MYSHQTYHGVYTLTMSTVFKAFNDGEFCSVKSEGSCFIAS